ncbi:MAG: transporter [Deltaproteobacteria bacterium]|nr:transporter [Deltaproteobacteria bacterium]
MIALILAAQQAHAQACVCSRNIAMPSGAVSRPGAVLFSLDYGAALSGDIEGWQGFSVTDLYGDSMAGMYMPPHFVQTVTLGGSVGLPANFAIAANLPYVIVHHVEPSEMPGDVDSNDPGDVDITVKYGWADKSKKFFLGGSLGPTLPTGTVIADSPVRSGRGTFGLTGTASGGLKLNPKLATVVQLAGSTGFGADDTGYTLGPTWNALAGVRWSPRENGRFSLAGYGIYRWTGTDQQDALVYRNTGSQAIDLAASGSYTFWEKEMRSAALSARVQVPLWQVVGDPMYIENVAGGLGISATVF